MWWAGGLLEGQTRYRKDGEGSAWVKWSAMWPTQQKWRATGAPCTPSHTQGKPSIELVRPHFIWEGRATMATWPEHNFISQRPHSKPPPVKTLSQIGEHQKEQSMKLDQPGLAQVNGLHTPYTSPHEINLAGEFVGHERKWQPATN